MCYNIYIWATCEQFDSCLTFILNAPHMYIIKTNEVEKLGKIQLLPKLSYLCAI